MATILDALNDGKFLLTEGLVIFKNSKRFAKLASKMERNLSVVEDNKEREEISNYIQSVKQAAADFSEVEVAYQNGNKDEARASYNKLRAKYIELVKKINTETMKKFIIAGGLLFIFNILLGGMQTINAPHPSAQKIDVSSIQDKINANNHQIAELKGEDQKLSALSKNLRIMKDLERRLETLKGQTGVN